jgi:ParB family chromosome partitioning protein
MLHVHEDDEPAVTPYVAPQQTQHVNYADMRPEAQGEQFQAQTYHYGMPPTPIREEQPVVQSEPEPVRQPLVAPSHYQTKQSVAPVSYSGVFNPVLVSEDEAKKPYEAVFQLDIDRIRPNPHQPRRVFDDDALRDLAASIREFGILQPLVVAKVERETPNGTEVNYELIAGERRWRASKLVGLPRVPAIIRQISVDRERLELAIIENLQREQLNAVEMARAYARLQDEFNMTQREVASRLGKSREVVANTLRLLDLPSDVQTAIEDGRISESHGRLLLGVTDPALQQSLFKDLLERQLTTRELRDRVSGSSQRGRKPARQAREAQPLSPELQMLQERLSSDLGAPVRIQATGEVGKITISFYSREELSAILEHLAAEADILL